MSKPIIRKMSEAFLTWCGDNSPAAKLERTIAQGVIGVTFGMFANWQGAPEFITYSLVPITMAIIAPIQATLAESNDNES